MLSTYVGNDPEIPVNRRQQFHGKTIKVQENL